VKVVGARRIEGDAIADQGRLARSAALLRGTAALAPRGVYRFRSFEEADEWMTTTMRRTHGRRNLRISSASAVPSTTLGRVTS
jgi:hypothetical protein